jgi:hypothetical protein
MVSKHPGIPAKREAFLGLSASVNDHFFRNYHVKTLQKYYRIDRREISFLKFIIEAYDGTAVLRTVDPEAGIVALHISPGCEPVVDMILNDLKQEIMIEDGSRSDLRNRIECL